MNLIVTPLHEEFDFLVAALTALGHRGTPERVGRLDTLRFSSLNLLVAKGGHGKTQFGIQTCHLLDHLPDVKRVICAGAAGGLAPELAVGDVVAATHTHEHDFNNKFVQRPQPRFEGDPQTLNQLRTLTQPDGFALHFGIVASGDEDVIEVERGRQLREQTGAIAVAWEGVGGARACRFSQTPFVELRGITDTADHNAPAAFEVNLERAMNNIARLLLGFRA